MATLRKLTTGNNFNVAADVPEVDQSVVGNVSMWTVKKIKVSPEQARTIFDQSALAELAASIKNHGVMQPLIVRSDGTLVAGERRFRASKLAGLVEVPVIVRDIADSKESFLLGLIENVQRVDLNPMEEARAYAVLVNDHAMTQDQIAGEVGKSRATVANLLRLNKLPGTVQEMIADCKLSAAHGYELLRLCDTPQACASVAADCVESAWSVSELRKNVDFKLNYTRPEKTVPATNGKATYTGTESTPLNERDVAGVLRLMLSKHTTGTLEARLAWLLEHHTVESVRFGFKADVADHVFADGWQIVKDEIETAIADRSKPKAQATKNYIAPQPDPDLLPDWVQDEKFDIPLGEALRQQPDNSEVVSGFSGGYSATNAEPFAASDEPDMMEIFRVALRRIAYYGLSDENGAEVRALFSPVIGIAEEALQAAGLE